MAILSEIPKIEINGKSYADYDFSNISLVQELLTPNQFHFSMQKKALIESENDITFSVAKELIGATVKCSMRTHKDIGIREIKGEYFEFSGIIVKANSNRYDRNGGNMINVVAYSPDYLMLDNPHCASYEDSGLSDIAADVIGQCVDIENEINPRMSAGIPYTVQYNENSYQFLSRLAQRYGEWFYYNGKKLVFGAPASEDTIELVYPSKYLFNYQYEVELKPTKFSHAVHNYTNYNNVQNEASGFTGASLHSLTDSTYDKASEVYKKNTLQDMYYGSMEQGEEESLQTSLAAQGMKQKARMTMCRGNSSHAGLRIGSKLKIKEVYADEGRVVNQEELIVTGVIHTFNINGSYENEFLAISSKSEYPPYHDGLFHPMAESQRAIVKDNKDPEQLGRVRVQFLWQTLQDESLLTPWIRVTQPHGGGNKGFYFIPEIDEEVMVGFENGNAEKPYVIGTLYHGEQKPGEGWYNDTNDVKAIRTRNGHTVEIYDQGEGGYIRIYDHEKENYILTFSTDEKLIKLESTGNIELYASNDIIMDAGNNIEMRAATDILREAGKNVEETAGENITVDAGKNIDVTAGENLTTASGKNTEMTAGENMDVTVGDNMGISVSEKYTVEANNILQDANEKVQQFAGSTWEQKAESSMKIDGGSKMDIAGDMIKIS